MNTHRIILSLALLLAGLAGTQAQTEPVVYTAQAWITAPGSGKYLEEQTAQELSSTASVASQCITVNATSEYQEIDGFGWFLNEGGCKLMKSQLHSTIRKNLLKEMYSVEEGLGASIVRVAIGASDMSESDYTYSPSLDLNLDNFSLAGPDLDYVIPVLKEILEINPNVKILAVPWTAPIWMKTGTAGYSGYMGGSLSVTYYGAYAMYFVKYLQAMEAEGIHIWAISPQNEPLHGGNNPSMTFSKETEYKFVNSYLGPKLAENGFGSVKIICYDHNCDNTEFPIYVCQSQYVAGSAFHLYGGDISAMSTVHSQTDKDVWFTEQWTGASGDAAGDYSWHMQNVMLGSVNNYGRSAIEWNIAADANSDPHTDGGCSDCKGAVTIGTNNVSSRNVSYYIVGTMSKVVRTGAKRIASSGAGSFRHAVFRNPDGSLAVVAYNTGSQQTLSVKYNGQSVKYTVPSGGSLSLLVPSAFDPFDTAVPETAAITFNPNAPCYNVLGQRVNNDYKGIVIQGGHKFAKQ